MRATPALIAALLCAALVAAGPAAGATCTAVDAQPVADNVADIAAAAVCLVNAEREARGLPALAQDRRLARSATGHAGDMVQRGYFAHESPDGIGLYERLVASGYLTGYGLLAGAEDIGWGEGVLATPRAIVDAWMSSDGHRAVVLSRRLREIGIGVAIGSPRAATGPSATYAADFGARTARRCAQHRKSGVSRIAQRSVKRCD